MGDACTEWRLGILDSMGLNGMEPSQMMIDGWDKGQWIPHKRETWPAHYGDVREETVLKVWDPKTRLTSDRVIPAGTTVRIVMASRFGDIGITDELCKEIGYHLRIRPEDLDNLRMNP